MPKVEDFYSVNEVNINRPKIASITTTARVIRGAIYRSMIEYLAHQSATGSATIALT